MLDLRILPFIAHVFATLLSAREKSLTTFTLVMHLLTLLTFVFEDQISVLAKSLTASLKGKRRSAAFTRVAVGTTNACKVAAVRRVLNEYSEVASGQAAAIEAYKVASDVAEQPMTLEETKRGAKNRANAARRAAMHDDDSRGPLLGIGIESGLFALDGKHLDVCVVAAYDGQEYHLGLSCAFEIPPPILQHVLHRGRDLSQACGDAGITDDPLLGEHGGLIGLLSSNRLTREMYTQQALATAVFPWLQDAKAWYRPVVE